MCTYARDWLIGHDVGTTEQLLIDLDEVKRHSSEERDVMDRNCRRSYYYYLDEEMLIYVKKGRSLFPIITCISCNPRSLTPL